MSRVGDPSSKYAYDYDGSQLQADIERNHREAEELYQEFRAWMIERSVDPRKIRPLFLRFVQEFFDGK